MGLYTTPYFFPAIYARECDVIVRSYTSRPLSHMNGYHYRR